MTIHERRALFLEKLRPYLLDMSALSRSPGAIPPAVYFLFGKGDRLLYIGCTHNLGHRLLGHSRDIPYDHAEWMPMGRRAADVEVTFIHFARPELNSSKQTRSFYENKILRSYELPLLSELDRDSRDPPFGNSTQSACGTSQPPRRSQRRAFNPGTPFALAPDARMS
jgi:hypothetical protein